MVYAVCSMHCWWPIHNTQPKKFTMFFLRYLHYIKTLSILICFNPQWIIITEQASNNIALNLIIYFLYKINILCMMLKNQIVNYILLLVEQLYV